MLTLQTAKQLRKKRLPRIRAVISGSPKCPRITILKSNRALFMQCIDDASGQILFALRKEGKNIQAAKELGAEVVKLAKEKRIKTIVFDRSGYRYHGVIQALVETMREGGLSI